MSDFVGADVDELRRLSRTLDEASAKLDEVQRIITGEVGLLVPQHWAGDDATEFTEIWATDADFLHRTATELHNTSVLALQEANQQDATSRGQ